MRYTQAACFTHMIYFILPKKAFIPLFIYPLIHSLIHSFTHLSIQQISITNLPDTVLGIEAKMMQHTGWLSWLEHHPVYQIGCGFDS